MIKKRSRSKTGDSEEKGEKKEEEEAVVAVSKSEKKGARRGKERGYWDNLGLV